MDIFNYHPTTNEYMSTELAELDPLAGEPLIPAHATSVSVIPAPTGYVPVFDGTTWNAVEDNRGIVYDTTTAVQSEHLDLGPLPAELTKVSPPELTSWDGNAWVDDIASIRTNQKSIIATSFDDDLSAGFTTSNGIKMNATYGDVMRLDAGVRLAESLSQINIDVRTFDNVTQTVLTTDAKTMVNEIGTNYQTALQQKWALNDQIDTASTRTDVELVVWV